MREFVGDVDPFSASIITSRFDKVEPEQFKRGMRVAGSIAESGLLLNGERVERMTRVLSRVMPGVEDGIGEFDLMAMLNLYSADRAYWAEMLATERRKMSEFISNGVGESALAQGWEAQPERYIPIAEIIDGVSRGIGGYLSGRDLREWRETGKAPSLGHILRDIALVAGPVTILKGFASVYETVQIYRERAELNGNGSQF